MTAALTGPTCDKDSSQRLSLTQEIARLADDLEKEVALLEEVDGNIEQRMNDLLSESIIPPSTAGQPESEATNAFARLSRSIHKLQYTRARLAMCCERL